MTRQLSQIEVTMHDAAAEATKPGWKTTEFWATAGSSVLAVLPFLYVLLGVKPEDQTALTESIRLVGTGLIMALGAGLSIWKYIQSRLEVKTAAVQAQAQAYHARMMSGFQAEQTTNAP